VEARGLVITGAPQSKYLLILLSESKHGTGLFGILPR
jgi:hypothetical protein